MLADAVKRQLQLGEIGHRQRASSKSRSGLRGKGAAWRSLPTRSHGVTWLTKVPQFANVVRGCLAMYSLPIQMVPSVVATAAE